VRSIRNHFERRRAEFRRYSSDALSDDAIDAMFRLAPDERAGLIIGRLPLDSEASIQIFERVVLDRRGQAVVERYSYFLILDGKGELRGYELDPSHDPASHRHDEQHRRSPSPQITLRAAMEDFWALLTEMRNR
jgi:hypothetical protein